MMKSLTVASAVLAYFCSHASAQRAAAPSADAPPATSAPDSAEARAAQLKAVVGLVTTPDRELNIANFEQIMQSRDARRIEIAVRTLIASDDPILRGLAMRGYLATARDLVLDIILPPNEILVLEEARKNTKGKSSLSAPYNHLREFWSNFRLTLSFTEIKMNEMRGKINTARGDNGDRANPEYTMRGDRLTFKGIAFFNGPNCVFELRPTKNAEITGTMSCDGSAFHSPIRIAAPMF